MKYASDFRSIARNALKGKWGAVEITLAVYQGTYNYKVFFSLYQFD